MSVSLDLAGSTVLVTGGARGAGVGIVDAFLRAGARVETCGRRPENETPVPEGVKYTSLDVRDAEAVDDWFRRVHDRHGRIDTLVNNVGGSPAGAFAAGSPRFHAKVLELNLLSAVYASAAAYEYLALAQGSIVNITSVSAARPSPGTAMYGAAKAGLENLTRSLAVEWAPVVRVNSVRCGLIDVPGATGHYGDDEQVRAIAATIPDGRFAEPAEIGAACVFLASSLSSHTTGAVLTVDGGGEWPAFLAHSPYPGASARPGVPPAPAR